MTLGALLSWSLCGLVVGLVARLLVPGRHRLGIIRTVLLGIVGAFVGGLIYWAINRSPGDPFAFDRDAWPGWIFSILGAVIVLLLYRWWERRQSWWRRWW